MNGKVRKGRKMRKRLIIGMSGASGAPLTIELLKQLQQYKEIIETHLIVTKGAEMTLEQETDYTLEQLPYDGNDRDSMQYENSGGNRKRVQ